MMVRSADPTTVIEIRIRVRQCPAGL